MKPRKLFVNLAVQDLDRSVEFFERLGFEFDPRFTDATATCMLIGEDTYAMLVVTDRFRDFTQKEIADTTTSNEAILALSADSRSEVDELAEKAASGGGRAAPGDDQGFMYSRGFEDPDGHHWDVFWMDPKALEESPEKDAAAA